MKAEFEINKQRFKADLSLGIDLSIPVVDGPNNVNAFFAPPPAFRPIRAGDFIGDINQGGPVNFYSIYMTPHGNGTHTECMGHIFSSQQSLLKCLTEYHFLAQVISLYPLKQNDGDRILTENHLEGIEIDINTKALIIRTLPNPEEKKKRYYSGSNPPYFHPDVIKNFVEAGIDHLLVDLPSVDREEDGGALLAHRAFWPAGDPDSKNRTITELIFVPPDVKDGKYILNLQISNIDLDASPCKPVIYAIES